MSKKKNPGKSTTLEMGTEQDVIPNENTKQDLVYALNLSYKNIDSILDVKSTKVINIDDKSEFIEKLIGENVEMIKIDSEGENIYLKANLEDISNDFFGDIMDVEDFDDENDSNEINNVGIQPAYKITNDGKLVLPGLRNAIYSVDIDAIKEIVYKGRKFIFL